MRSRRRKNKEKVKQWERREGKRGRRVGWGSVAIQEEPELLIMLCIAVVVYRYTIIYLQIRRLVFRSPQALLIKGARLDSGLGYA